jgi:putative Mg2+ transporter-C (MgtC) family protein
MEHLAALWSLSALGANGVILLHVVGALGIGCVIGYERAFHGRAAGLRTFALVCAGSTLLTAICGFPGEWFPTGAKVTAAVDPTRVIQGIVTGIGFIGAGVIMKDGFSIRGLSTAASIWMTAAIGITLGMGFVTAAITSTLLLILVMAGFRKVEYALPHRRILHLSLSFARQSARPLKELCASLEQLGVAVTDLACQLDGAGNRLDYDLVLEANGGETFDRLAEALSKDDEVLAFHLAPARD